jgi:hypothetical protein
MKNTLRVTFVTLLTPLLISCGGGGDNGCSAVLGLLPGAGCSTPNTAPVANAGVTQNVSTGSLVTLDGTGSRDVNNQSLTYLWQMTAVPAGSLAALSSSTSAKPSFTADVSGSYTVSLVVNDGKTNSPSSVMNVYASINNVDPVANAGTHQSVSIGSVVTLDGTTSSDANRDTLTYKWRLGSVPLNSTATLSSTVSPNPKFTADLAGTYSAILTVNDGKVESTPSVVTITASPGNQKPIAKAGASQNVSLKTGMTPVTLDGTESFDKDNDRITYKWTLVTKPDKSTASLINDTTPKPSFNADVAGTYVASLTVYDGKLYSDPDSNSVTSVTVSANNSAPVADAGVPQNVKLGLVRLDGTKSYDPNGDSFGFAWKMISMPATSTASINDATSPTPTFEAKVVGTYVASLVVTDSKLLKSENTATVTINVTATNNPPEAIVEKNQTALLGTVKLDGSKSVDKDGDALKYKWALLASPATSKATLSNVAIASPTFDADKAGIYVFSLIVNDNLVDSVPVTVTVTASAANLAPTANAGEPQNVITGNLVTLDGSKSSDPNPGDPMNYKWAIVTKPAGSLASLTDETSARPTFRADISGVYLFSLVVNDGKESSSVVTTTVTAATANSAPTANAGVAQSVSTGIVTLDGSASFDVNGDRLTYAWSFLAKPVGSTAQFVDSTSPKPQFTADQPGTYIAGLLVNDGKVSSTMATTQVIASVANSAPVAVAGAFQNVVTGQPVTVDGSGSTDANGDVLNYTWLIVSKPTDSSVTLPTGTAAKRIFTTDKNGTYVLSLRVNDGKVDSSNIDYVTITAGAANLAPVANAGVAQTVARNTQVKLDASASTDANGDILIYRWVLTYRPTNSTAVLSSATAREPTFTADQAGVYVATLVVSDGRLDSTQVTIAITATP